MNDDLETWEDDGTIEKKHVPKKVEIIIEAGQNYCDSVKNGAEYTSVGFNTSIYGSGSPCDNEEEIESSIKYAKEWIKREGDIPIVNDLRKKVDLSSFF